MVDERNDLAWRIDIRSRRVIDRVMVGDGPQSVAVAGDLVWIAHRDGTLEDPRVRASVPLADALFRAIRQGRPRPVSPAYDAISDAISNNVHAALRSPPDVSPKAALERMQVDIDKALATASAG
jgi:hypothetical protein